MPIDNLTALEQKMREARKKKRPDTAGACGSEPCICQADRQEDEGANQMKMLYCSCPSEMRETLLRHTQETAKELTELSEKFETN